MAVRFDYFQHPAKYADPKRQYHHAYDVYSLGILLLEIGLWGKLKDYDDSSSESSDNLDYEEEDHYERRRWVCREYLDSSDDEISKASERELCARFVADLEGCQA